MSVVVVSNRIVRPCPDAPIDGGLAAALLPAVERSGAVWVGASGRLSDAGEKGPIAEIAPLGAGSLVAVDLPRAHYAGYYEGYANSGLWPALHERADLIRASVTDFHAYCAVNAFMARALMPFIARDTLLWVHDYHFLLLGAELRRLGVKNRIGFFLHTPFPPPAAFMRLPQHRALVEAMLAYNLIGFQTAACRDNFAAYARDELHLKVSGRALCGPERRTHLGAFPIGIEPESFARQARLAFAGIEVSRLRSSLQGAQLVIGVDRIDPSKGLLERMRAFARLFELHPEHRRNVCLLQIAVPSRQQIEAYRSLQAELARLVGTINGTFSEVDWVPIRYLARGFPQAKLAGLYRAARVGLVTPLRDGMNLVAKEYVASQNPLDPGVLVLSRHAGAARQLDAALLVDPENTEAMAQAIAAALAMPLAERRDRWNALMLKIAAAPLSAWFADFIRALRATAPFVDEPAQVAAAAAPALRRAAGSALQAS